MNNTSAPVQSEIYWGTHSVELSSTSRCAQSNLNVKKASLHRRELRGYRALAAAIAASMIASLTGCNHTQSGLQSDSYAYDDIAPASTVSAFGSAGSLTFSDGGSLPLPPAMQYSR